MIWFIFGALLICWLAFNYAAPFALLGFSQRMSIGRIPADILRRANAHKVAYYVANLQRGYAFSIWLGWRYAVVIDKNFLRAGAPAQIRFVLAHELGHCVLGHLRLRWLAVVSGLVLFKCVRVALARLEDRADDYAEGLSGLPRAVLTDSKLNQMFDALEKARS